MLKSNVKKTQFEHYKLISDEYSIIYNNHYLLFSDDDDVWSKKRTLNYAMLIKLTDLSNETADYVIYPYLPKGKKYMSNGLSVVNKYMEGKIEIIGGESEYVSYCILMKNFTKFVNECDTKILNHKYCDRYFIKILSNPELKMCTIKVPLFGFGYYYHNKYYHKEYQKNTLKIADSLDLIYNYYAQTKKIRNYFGLKK